MIVGKSYGAAVVSFSGSTLPPDSFSDGSGNLPVAFFTSTKPSRTVPSTLYLNLLALSVFS